MTKPGPLISTAAGEVVDLQGVDDAGGDLAGVAAQPLGQGQGDVGLEVRELRGPDHRVGGGVLGAERVAERLLEARGDLMGGAGHASRLGPYRNGPLNCTAGPRDDGWPLPTPWIDDKERTRAWRRRTT